MRATWAERDLPVLSAAVAALDEGLGDLVTVDGIASATGLSPDDVGRAALALEDEYLTLTRTMGGVGAWGVVAVTPAARRAAGQWPAPGDVVDQIVAALESAAEMSTDESRRTTLRGIAMGLMGAGRDIAVQVLATTIAKTTGVG